MPSLGPVVLGAIAVFVLVLGSLVMQGRRQASARKAQRRDLGLERMAVPDPVLTASLLSAFAASAGTDYALAGLERVRDGAPGTWYVAMVKATSATTGAAAVPAAAAAEPMRVLLAIDGLPQRGESSEPIVIEGTNHVWTRRWASGLLLVESTPGAGDAARDFDGMKDAGTRAVSAATGQ